jgi:predicted unusual protein kinase regulating ubiquinone biosynthesis (AarF/ABC1/UbiB family)
MRDDALPSSSARSSNAPAYTPPASMPATLEPVLGNMGNVSEKKRKKLASAIFDMTIKMYLRDNYIHGDLHGGNLLYSTDEDDERVFVLDAGLTTALERDWASPFGYMLHALTSGDASRVGEKLLMFNINEHPVDRQAFTAELHHVSLPALVQPRLS